MKEIQKRQNEKQNQDKIGMYEGTSNKKTQHKEKGEKMVKR